MQTLYNLDYIVEITNGKKDKINLILQKFMFDAPASVKKLNELHDQKNMTGLKGAAHSMKPIFSSIGAESAINAIDQIEQFCSSPVFYELIQIELGHLDKICYAICKDIDLQLKQ